MNLREKPFFLTEEQIGWVEKMRDSMTLRQKVGQLFCVLGDLYEHEELRKLAGEYGIGGILFRPRAAQDLKNIFQELDAAAPVPLLKAANLEEGANGAILEGTHFATPMQVAASDDINMVEKFAKACVYEAQKAGINVTYSPVADIDYNFRNPITNIRTYGSDPSRVREYTSAYVKTVQEMGIAATAKHFPGDGVDYRDQHLHPTYNMLSAEEWYATYGAVYQQLINDGLMSIMAGHIVQPAVTMEVNPSLSAEDCLPASMCRELLSGVLREKFGFEGVITTDATIMGGYTMAMERHRAIPWSIEAGCDMLVFNTDFYEDHQAVMDGIASGILSGQRLEEAVTRILALKAKVACAQWDYGTTGLETEIYDAKIQQWASECAEESVTLVKDKEGLLPITPEKFPEIRLVLLGEDNTTDGSLSELVKKDLEQEGFAVKIYDPYQDDLHGTAGLQKNHLSLYLAHIPTESNKVTIRVDFCSKHALDLHRYPNEEPGIFVSFQNPYHLQDVPRMRTFINAYTPTAAVVHAVVDKLTGKSIFCGVSPVDPFCGMEDTRF